MVKAFSPFRKGTLKFQEELSEVQVALQVNRQGLNFNLRGTRKFYDLDSCP